MLHQIETSPFLEKNCIEKSSASSKWKEEFSNLQAQRKASTAKNTRHFKYRVPLGLRLNTEQWY